MALSPADHLKRAQYNEDFARWLGGEKSKWPSWAVVAVFYSAVHHAQAMLVHNGHRPERHKARNELLRGWPDVRSPYMRLFHYAHDARYMCRDPDEKKLGYAFSYLADVKDATKKYL